MAVTYPFLSAAVVIDSTNKVLRMGDDVGDFDVTLAEGTYFVTGSGGADDLLTEIQTKAEAASVVAGGSNAFSITFAPSIDPASRTAQINTGSDGDWELYFDHDNTTFDVSLLGFVATTYNAPSGDYASTLNPSSIWTSTEPTVRIYDEEEARTVVQHVTEEGQAYTFQQADARILRRLRFDWIDRRRVLDVPGTAAGSETPAFFRRFWREHLSAGKRFYVHELEGASGSNLTPPSATNTALQYIARGESLERFAPERMSANDTWGWDLMLRKYVA